jgi:Uma2 family endonuclease
LRLNERKIALCELVNGTLVEKAMGTGESYLSGDIYVLLYNFVVPRRLGYLAPGDGMFRILPATVRGPDVCFVSVGRCPGGKRPNARIPDVVPELVVEVLTRIFHGCEGG